MKLSIFAPFPGHRLLGLAALLAVFVVVLLLGPGAALSQSAPSVATVTVSSDAGNDNTYLLGETIRITLTFSEAVNVTGTPQLKIDMDPAEWGEKQAGYENGSGTASLTFTHTVVEPNVSTQGIAVLADTLALNGGSINSASSNTAAGLSHAGMAHDASHKVDWQASSPTVATVAVTSDAGDDDTYAKDDVIEVTLTFGEAVDVTGTPQLKIDMDPAEWGEKQAGYENGSGTASLTFAYTVVEPNVSTQGIAVLADTLDLNGGSIQSAAQIDASLAHAGLGHDASHKVDWQKTPQAMTPTVSSVTVTSDAGDDDTYAKDDVIEVTLTLSEAVDVTGAPRLTIKMDPNFGEKQAGYHSGTGTASLTFTHTVVEPNVSTQGIAVLADTLELNGGTIQSASSDADANLAHAGLGHDASHKVDWQKTPQAITPTVSSVAVTSDAGDDDTYAKDDVIEVTLTLSEAVDVTGAPRLTIKMDPNFGEKQAGYHSGTGTASLTFTHTVVEPNVSTQGIAVLADTLELNGGTIQSASSDADANLAHAGLGHDADHKVDWEQVDPNLAPVINTESAGYADFNFRGNAPRATLVSKRFDGIFSDPDGDNLTYSVALASDNSRLVGQLRISDFGDTDNDAAQSGFPLSVVQRVYFEADAEADWKAMNPQPPVQPVASVTLTATDPGGLSASVNGDFLIHWETYPELESVVAGTQAITLSYDMAVLDDPAPTPGQFSVNVVNPDGSTGTIAVSSLTVNGPVVTLALESELSEGQTATLNYANATKTPVRAANGWGHGAPGFSGQAVTVSQPAPTQQVIPAAAAARGYRGQLGEVLVELSLRRSAQPTSQGARGASDGAQGQSSHTTSIVYVIDDSGSLDGDYPEVRTALKDVRGTTMASTKVALIAFGTDATTVFGLTDHSTDATTGPWTDARINAFGGKLGGTFYSSPLENAKALLDADGATTTKKIIFLTDAQAPRPSVIDNIVSANAANGATDVDIVVDTIGFGDYYLSENFEVIEEIATDTGGTYRAGDETVARHHQYPGGDGPVHDRYPEGSGGRQHGDAVPGGPVLLGVPGERECFASGADRGGGEGGRRHGEAGGPGRLPRRNHAVRVRN